MGIQRRGPSFLLHRVSTIRHSFASILNLFSNLYKNKVFIIMVILGLLFLIYLSNTIFSVNIISMNKDLNEKIIKELDSYGIKKS